MQYSASHQVLTLKERSSSSSTVVDDEFTIQVASSSTSTEQGDTRRLRTPLVGEDTAAVTDKSVPAMQLNPKEVCLHLIKRIRLELSQFSMNVQLYYHFRSLWIVLLR